MKSYIWVRLLFRAMGVLFIGLAVPQCFQFLGQLLSLIGSTQIRTSWLSDGWQLLYTLGWGGGGVIQLGFGIYLLFFGKRLREYCLRDEPGHCPRCDYECGTAGICPECGLPQKDTPATPAPAAASNPATPLPPK